MVHNFSRIISFIKLLLFSQTFTYCQVNTGFTLKMIIIQICKRSIHSIDSSGRLLNNLVGIVLRIENDRISCYAVPTFGPCIILNELHPASTIRNRFVLMTIPLGYCDVRIGVFKQVSEYFKFIVIIIEYYHLRMLFKYF